MVNKYKAKQVCVETVAYQNSQYGLINVARRNKKAGEIWFKLIGEKHKAQMHKVDRIIHGLEPLFDEKKVHFKKQHLEAIKEFMEFPQSEHDDIPDTLWLALNRSKRCPAKVFPTIGYSEHVKRRKKKRDMHIDALTMA